ncbi:MAG: thiamine-phosphate kinase [Stappiaceae bacterium]
MSDQRPGEFELIKRHLAPLADNSSSLGLEDDAAVFRPPADRELVFTKDVLAENIHFFSDDPPDLIARKALRVNLSDLAAKGATPSGYLMGLCLPTGWTEDWIEQFCAGLAEDQRTYDFSLFGGDTIKSSGGLTISITAIGHVPTGSAVVRSGARPGDALYVTGTIGDAALGLLIRQGASLSSTKEHTEFLTGRYLLPEPKMDTHTVLRDFASAAMDISDGLAADLGHLCDASGVGARIQLEKIPLSAAARVVLDQDRDRFSAVIMGGDDYELLVSVPAKHKNAFELASERLGTPVSQIGVVTEGADRLFLDEAGERLAVSKSGFTHF